jgi:Arc/MetJ-type ribon-helix-helix transcriptional regulator
MKIELPASLEKMVREKVDAGEHPDAVSVISDAVAQMQARDQAERMKATQLLEAIRKGQRDFDEGRFVEFENEEEFNAFFETL